MKFKIYLNNDNENQEIRYCLGVQDNGWWYFNPEEPDILERYATYCWDLDLTFILTEAMKKFPEFDLENLEFDTNCCVNHEIPKPNRDSEKPDRCADRSHETFFVSATT